MTRRQARPMTRREWETAWAPEYPHATATNWREVTVAALMFVVLFVYLVAFGG